jgi:hypothetical protein
MIQQQQAEVRVWSVQVSTPDASSWVLPSDGHVTMTSHYASPQYGSCV